MCGFSEKIKFVIYPIVFYGFLYGWLLKSDILYLLSYKNFLTAYFL